MYSHDNKEITRIPWDSINFNYFIGSGSYGNVYQGTWQNNVVAVKQIDLKSLPDSLQKDLEIEIKILTQFQHPHVVSIYGACKEEHYYIVMEYMPKGSLYAVLQNIEIDLPLAIRYKIATDIGKALCLLHSINFWHQNLNSLNILLDENYRAKITDFGLSKYKLETNTLTSKNNNPINTTYSIAPELLTMERADSATKEANIYSYGMIMWEIITRKIPYRNISNKRVVELIKQGEKEKIPEDCPVGYATLIEKTWSSPNSRPFAYEIVAELKKNKPHENRNSVDSHLDIVWGRKNTPHRQPSYKAVRPKNSGSAIGAEYIPEDKPYSAGWIGKLGYNSLKPKNTIPEIPNSTLMLQGWFLDAMLEKIAADLYCYLSNGNFFVPKTRLAELPFENEFTKSNDLTVYLEQNIYLKQSEKINDGVFVMSKKVVNYLDLAELTGCVLDGKPMNFLDCLHLGKLPEKVIIENRIIPINGIIEILAAARLLADIDAMGKAANNTGYVIERNNKGEAIAVHAVKVDPGFSFNFSQNNLLYKSKNSNMPTDNVDKNNSKDLQYCFSKEWNPLPWNNLTEKQKFQFLHALDNGLSVLTDKGKLLKFIDRKAFQRTPKQRALPSIKENWDIEDLERHLDLQKEIYAQELKQLRKIPSFQANQTSPTRIKQAYFSGSEIPSESPPAILSQEISANTVIHQSTTIPLKFSS